MDKTALITGGSSGLGYSIAKKLQSENYDLILIARDIKKLEQVKDTLKKANSSTKISIYSCDLSDDDAVNKTFADINKNNQKVDFLVLNAGIAHVSLLRDYESLSDVTHEIKVNLLSAVSTTYSSLAILKPDSHILFVSSGFGLIGPAAYSLYAATKAGIINFAESIRRELINDDISVHVTCPGDIDTPMYQSELKTMPDWVKEKLGRAKPQNPDEIASSIIDECFKEKFMIIPSLDVKFLIYVKKLLPAAIYTFIGDKILPLPPSG